MKLLRYGPTGSEKPGLLDAKAASATSPAWSPTSPATLSAAGAGERCAALDPATLPLVRGNRAPRRRRGAACGKFICIGLNYADHAAESGAADARASRSSS